MSSKKGNRNLLIVIGLVVVAAAVTFFDGNKNPAKHELVGQSVVESAKFETISSVTISKGEKKIEIQRAENGFWSVKEGEVTFPADGRKISAMMDQLSKSKVERIVSKDPAAAVGMETPTDVQFAQGSTTFNIVLGERRQGGGQYLKLAGPEVFLISEAIEVSPDSETWELKTLVDLKKDVIKSVDVAAKRGAASLVMTREKAEDKLAVANLAKNEKMRDSNVEQLERGLEALQFTNRVDLSNEPAKSAMSATRGVRYTLFDGRTYDVAVGKIGTDKDEKYFIKITAGKNGATVTAEIEAEMEQLNRLMGAWYFEVPAYVGKKFEKEKSDLIEQVKS
jgi:hypothetical protein